MQKKQEGYSLPVTETKMEEKEPEISATKEEVAMLSIEDLDALLHKSESVATVASMSEKEIDEMVEQRQDLLERLCDVHLIEKSRLQKVENFNPLKDLEASDYERLVEEGIIDASYAERLKKLDSMIARFESIDYPSTQVKIEMEELSRVRNAIREKIESQIAEQQQEIATRREEIKNKIIEHYAKRVEELEEKIAKIEANPRVLERLQIMAEKEKRAAEALIEKERKAIIQEAARYIKSLEARQINAFKRIGELVGNEKIYDELIKALGEEDERKQESIFKETLNRLINAIINGEGEKQLKNPSEVVPWEVRTTSIPYIDAINELRHYQVKKELKSAAEAGDKNAQVLLQRREKIFLNNKILFSLFGPKWIVNNKTGEERLNVFWVAFEKRKRNDRENIIAMRKKEQEEIKKREAAFEKAAEEIIKRGGIVVEVEIIKKVGNKREVVGIEKGVVRLEKRKSKKGNEFWEVVELFGATPGLKVGHTSPFDMRSFPKWFRDSVIWRIESLYQK